ncbi:hypothetical protein AKJ53_01450 [candidate division MSBL1 archaeon SCGC-AAA382F02]|uniref:ABC transporter domain-containing protein n=1 Tax=candidate division MSBL1 archaeon SCGC-AAA382F02 TaxID=1698282 RepID=A0A133VHZ1_9EURY|nr:hypothetical protein AKJ53_01450 [candidate division MSBL1 archaeon SCGC-AAA382F02]
MNNIIETKNLTKEFEDVVAVNGVDLEVEEGSIHGFVGPNGAGKTTTMRMLVGTLKPTKGEAYIGGETAGSLAAKEIIGYSPQFPQFYGSMTGLDYLEYMGRMAGIGSKAEKRAKVLLKWLGLKKYEDKKVGGYSGGMKRKLSLAQAMIHEPELLILDEPTATLDPAGRMSIIESLEKLTKEKGMTVFVSSHVLTELEKFIDHVTILNEGEVVTSNTLDELAETYASEAYLISTSDNEKVLDLIEDKSFVNRAWLDDDDNVNVLTSEPEEFKSELVGMIAKKDLRLDSLTRAGGLEDAFIKAIEEKK